MITIRIKETNGCNMNEKKCTAISSTQSNFDNPIDNLGTAGDIFTKKMIQRILTEGRMDINPRPVYKDYCTDENISNEINSNKIFSDETKIVYENGIPVRFTPAHTLSVNHAMVTYNIAAGESPLITLRPIAIKNSIAEILWIYQGNNDLVIFDKIIGHCTWDEDHKINNWWKDWALKNPDGSYYLNNEGHPTIGTCYGETVRRHNLMKNLLFGLVNNPDGRRHIINLWQEDDFKEPHGLKPCAFLTEWNVRHEDDGDYLDMCLVQRSSDFLTAGCINQMQYVVLLELVARHTGYKVGKFSWMVNNIQIYDRHIDAARDLLKREPVKCMPSVWINPNKKNFFSMVLDDIKIMNYPKSDISVKNPQIQLDLGI